MPETLTLTRWPAPPANVTRAFCPGTVVVTLGPEPPGEVVALASTGTS